MPKRAQRKNASNNGKLFELNMSARTAIVMAFSLGDIDNTEPTELIRTMALACGDVSKATHLTKAQILRMRRWLKKYGCVDFTV
jgi:hypothetical protein